MKPHTHAAVSALPIPDAAVRRDVTQSCCSGRRAQVLALAVCCVAFVLLFARLGHYALWDDEALVALSAKAILQTGDTAATVDHNIVAYRGGILLKDLKDRGLPPLAAYVTALSFALFGESAWAARLPFAFLGLMVVFLLVHWSREACRAPGQLLAVYVALLTNVSFFLFCRQCRYYALVLFLSTLLAWLYLNWPLRRWNACAMSLACAALFAAHSLAFVTVLAALCVDYFIWGRRDRKFSIPDAMWFVLPQAVINALVLSRWNPMATEFGRYASLNTLGDRTVLFLEYIRDVTQCEFLSLPLLAAGAWLAWRHHDRWLARGISAIVVILFVASAVSPQVVQHSSVADVRYVTPLIPLAMGVGNRALWMIAQRNATLALALCLPLYVTNVGNGGPLLWCGVRSTAYEYLGELITPCKEPYSPTAHWLRDNVGGQETVWVVPDYFTYPLMFHAPRPLYAWQIERATGQFSAVDDTHIRGKVPPRYIVCFGPSVAQLNPFLDRWQAEGVTYTKQATLDVFWKDLYRPELFWRSFKTVTPRNVDLECVYVFRLEVP